MARLLGLLALVAACARSLAPYELPVEDFPKNGVPYVSPDGDVFPSYLERAALMWNGAVCCRRFSPVFNHAHVRCSLLWLCVLCDRR